MTLVRLAVCSLLALSPLAMSWAGDEGAFDLEAVGKVVAVGKESVVVKTDLHGHRIAFAIGQSSRIPEGLKVGSHVKVDYHATGSTGQMIDEVEMVGRATADARPADKAGDTEKE